MKRFTSFMLMLLVAVTTWAEVNPKALPEMSTEGNIKWYTIKNTRSGKYATFNGESSQMSQQTTAGMNSFFYFTASDAETAEGFTPVMVHNAGTDKMLSNWAEWTSEGKAWFVSTTDNSGTAKGTGLHISNSAKYEGWNSWNDGGSSSITNYIADDEGSIFVMDLVTDFTSVINVRAAKEAAIAELNNLATVSVIYPATTKAVEAINAVEAAGTGLAELDAAIEAINAIVADYKTNAYKALEGKYYTLFTPGRNGYAKMTVNGTGNAESVGGPEFIWQFVENNGSVNIYNPYIGKYLVMNGTSAMNVTANADEASAFDIKIVSEPAKENAKVGFISNDWYIHLNGSLLGWYSGGASEWQVTLVDDFSEMISDYKTSTIATLDQWATLSVVFDASLINGAKTAINDINTNSFATIAAIDAEIKKVTDAVAAKMFTFQTLATEANRKNYWVSAGNAGKAIGTANQDYSSIWSLIHAGGVSFYMYNELNQVYMGAPSANCPLTEIPSVAYTFEIVDAENGVVEMKCNGETLHVGNDGDGKLLNYDHDENASRWYIRTIDVAADIQTILDGLTEDDYAPVPALGQYTTAAYEALVAARTNAKTVEEVEAAIAAFNKAKNRPVFTISGTKSYIVGKSLYEDEGNTNGKGNDCYFKTTNKYDKTMWWVFDQTSTTVGVTGSVAVVNYATGNPIWGVENLKITETSDAVDGEDDGIFLFYSVGNDTPLHFQESGAVLCRYGSYTADSGSAAIFTYVGNTYDLDKLTDGHISALAALQTAYDSYAAYANVTVGTGLHEYAGEGEKGRFIEAFEAAKTTIDAAVSEQANKTVDQINKLATEIGTTAEALAATMNMPAAGKYYYLKNAAGYLSNKKNNTVTVTAEAGLSNIYYLESDGENTYLVSYESGLYLTNPWNIGVGQEAINGNEVYKQSKTFVSGLPGTYALEYLANNGNKYYFNASDNNTNAAVDSRYQANGQWTLEEVTELPVSISANGYASFYAPVAVELEGGVTAHTVTVDGTTAVLSEPMTVVPANTGVVLVGAVGNYSFAITTADAFDGENLMKGSVAKTIVTKPENTQCYVLAMVDEKFGFYVAVNGDDKTTFYNAGHKAYLAVEASKAQGVKSYSIGLGDGTTAVEDVVVENEVKAIYDLTGRRVEAITAAGIYIVNGKKVLVK